MILSLEPPFSKGNEPVIFGRPASLYVPDVVPPHITRLIRLGNANVVLPSPVPQVVPIASNNAEYVVLLIAEPLQIKYPEGTEEPENHLISPGIVWEAPNSISLNDKFPA